MMHKIPHFFWRIKVAAGMILILLVLDSQFSALLPLLFDTPRLLAQAVVLLGSGSVLYHYWVLKRTAGSMDTPSTLVMRGGLYSRVRHPMYLSDMVMYIGFVIFAPSILSLIVYALAILALYQQARAEDDSMAHLFADEYQRWCESSSLLFPVVFK